MSRIGHLLTTTVPVYRAHAQDDGGGGQDVTWVLVGTVRARRSQPTERERVRGDQVGTDLDETWYVAPGTDVRYGDRLRPPGRDLEVIAIYEPSVPGTYLRLDCTIRTPEEG